MANIKEERILEPFESIYGHVEIVTKRGCFVRAEDKNIEHFLYYRGDGKIGGRVLLQVRRFNEARNTYDSFLDSYDYDAPAAA